MPHLMQSNEIMAGIILFSIFIYWYRNYGGEYAKATAELKRINGFYSRMYQILCDDPPPVTMRNQMFSLYLEAQEQEWVYHRKRMNLVITILKDFYKL